MARDAYYEQTYPVKTSEEGLDVTGEVDIEPISDQQTLEEWRQLIVPADWLQREIVADFAVAAALSQVELSILERGTLERVARLAAQYATGRKEIPDGIELPGKRRLESQEPEDLSWLESL